MERKQVGNRANLVSLGMGLSGSVRPLSGVSRAAEKPPAKVFAAAEPAPYPDAFPIPRPVTAVKRALDITVGLAGTAAFLCAYPLLALLIKWESPGPVLYLQSRVGRDRRSKGEA